MSQPLPYGQPPMAQPQRSFGFDVRYSYKGRLVLAFVLGIPPLLGGIVLMVMALLADPPQSPEDKYGPLTCRAALVEEESCQDFPEVGGKRYSWKVYAEGSYKLSLKPSPIARSLELDKSIGGAKLGAASGKANAPVSVTVKMKAGEYSLKVDDPNATADAKKPFVLVIEKAGAPPKPGPDRTPTFVGIGAIILIGLIFIGAIPATLRNEWIRIPRRIDASGVTSASGVLLPWNTYRGATIRKLRTRSGNTYEVGLELDFAMGRPYLPYRAIKNMNEIGPIIGALKENRNPFA